MNKIFIKWFQKIADLLLGKLGLMAINVAGYTIGTIGTSSIVNAGGPPLYSAGVETGGGALLPLIILAFAYKTSPLSAANRHRWDFLSLLVFSTGMNALYALCLNLTGSAVAFTGTCLAALLATTAIPDSLALGGNREKSAPNIVRWKIFSVILPILAGGIFALDAIRRQDHLSLSYALGLLAGAGAGVLWGLRIWVTKKIEAADRRYGRKDADIVKMFASLIGGATLLGWSATTEHLFALSLAGSVVMLFTLALIVAGILTTAAPQMVETRALGKLNMKPTSLAMVNCLLPAATMVGTAQLGDAISDLLMAIIVSLCLLGVYTGGKLANTTDK